MAAALTGVLASGALYKKKKKKKKKSVQPHTTPHPTPSGRFYNGDRAHGSI
jgi:hypothetical protein